VSSFGLGSAYLEQPARAIETNMEITCTLRVVNHEGMHARPCHAVVSTALGFQSQLRLRAAGPEVNGKSILELMTLGAGEGTEITMRAWGSDSKELAQALQSLFEGGFGEIEKDSTSG
jgi:phosphotransferase system HPr (HPr) family protein